MIVHALHNCFQVCTYRYVRDWEIAGLLFLCGCVCVWFTVESYNLEVLYLSLEWQLVRTFFGNEMGTKTHTHARTHKKTEQKKTIRIYFLVMEMQWMSGLRTECTRWVIRSKYFAGNDSNLNVKFGKLFEIVRNLKVKGHDISVIICTWIIFQLYQEMLSNDKVNLVSVFVTLFAG